MCDPISVVLSVGSALLQNYSQQQAAEAQVEATYDAAVRQQELMYQQIAEKQDQINQQSTLEQSERMKQGMIERAQIATIAGESGALGFSSDRLIGDSYMQQSMDIGSMETNRSNAIKQTEWEAKQANLSGESAVARAKAANPGSSMLATGLQIAGDGYSIYKDSKTKGIAKGTA